MLSSSALFLSLSSLLLVEGSPIKFRRQASADIGNFGSCSVPQIQFAVGFDNRKETSFEPVDQVSYNHGSADNIDIITQFMCDTLTNTCDADAQAKATCATATAAADAAAKGTGAQADAFNAAFNIKTDFASVQQVDDQGNDVGTPAAPNGAATIASIVSFAATSAAASATVSASVATSTASASQIGDFGSCSVPQIQFAVGFDGRKETSFEPVDQTSYNHGSADNIDIITQFMCDTLTNSCGANALAKQTCATATTAADAAAKGTGAQADAFNAAFGITTDFAAVQEVNDQGQFVGTAAAASGAAQTSAAAVTTDAAVVSGAAATCPAPSTVTVTAQATGAASVTSAALTNVAIATTAAAATSTSSSSSIGNFGSCSIPQIQFAVGFDNRKETSFEPVDQVSYNHGSADNIDIITQFMCDQLVNSCKADATAQATCATAKQAADTAAKGTGAQADAFNAVFGITTDFAAVQEVDDQGNDVGTPAAPNGAATSASIVSVAATSAVVTSATAASSTSAASTSSSTSTSTSSSIGNFGSCSVPQIQFAAGLDGRKETAFAPVDETSYNHGSADNIAVITQFICLALTNTCGADATAKATCATATSAANAQTPLTGAQADAFNAAFGIKTDFAAVQQISNTGVAVRL